MNVLAQGQKNAILSAYDFSATDSVVDIGGGQGGLLIALLERYPTHRGVLFDQPETIARAQTLLAEHRLEPRCHTAAGSFFETALPEGKDLYILKHVLNNWDDDNALQILKNCRQAMETGKRLLVIEGMIDEHTGLRLRLLDLMMLVSFASGKLRAEAELKALLAAAGFEQKRIIPTPTDISIVEAVAF